MAGLLPTGFFGTSAAAILINSDTRIYYQANDGAIHEASGVNSVVLGDTYSDRVVVHATEVRVNSPIAVTTWGAKPEDVSHLSSHQLTVVSSLNLSRRQIRLYYIDCNSQVRELRYDIPARAWLPGQFNEQKYMAVGNSSFLYAIGTHDCVLRVGFQSVSAPASITQAEWVEGGWKSAVLGGPSEG
jgi:hypothetical protein